MDEGPMETFTLRQFINTPYNVFGRHSSVIHFLLKPIWCDVALSSFQGRLIYCYMAPIISKFYLMWDWINTPPQCLAFITSNSMIWGYQNMSNVRSSSIKWPSGSFKQPSYKAQHSTWHKSMYSVYFREYYRYHHVYTLCFFPVKYPTRFLAIL